MQATAALSVDAVDPLHPQALALLSEAALAAEWQRPEEDAAWVQFNRE